MQGSLAFPPIVLTQSRDELFRRLLVCIGVVILGATACWKGDLVWKVVGAIAIPIFAVLTARTVRLLNRPCTFQLSRQGVERRLAWATASRNWSDIESVGIAKSRNQTWVLLRCAGRKSLSVQAWEMTPEQLVDTIISACHAWTGRTLARAEELDVLAAATGGVLSKRPWRPTAWTFAGALLAIASLALGITAPKSLPWEFVAEAVTVSPSIPVALSWLGAQTALAVAGAVLLFRWGPPFGRQDWRAMYWGFALVPVVIALLWDAIAFDRMAAARLPNYPGSGVAERVIFGLMIASAVVFTAYLAWRGWRRTTAWLE
jgi:hypothetical protein